MAQQVKVLAIKPDNLSLFLGTYMVEGENDSCKLSSDLYIHVMPWSATYLHSHTQCLKKYKTSEYGGTHL